ncbi:MAG: GWxTD domain-containing protein [Bacteroidota bacterium]|nr:GWxTD domain-containing protein [Bacteroidota bacterium]
MKHFITLCLFILVSFAYQTTKAESFSSDTLIYSKVVQVLTAEKDTIKAISLLKESIKKNSDLASYCRLSEIYISKNTTTSKELAKYYINKGLEKYPGNISLKILSARVLENSFRNNAISEYEKILKQDSTCISALIGIARIKEDFYNIYYQSAFQDEETGRLLYMPELVTEDFNSAIHYYTLAAKYDATNFEPYLRISFLYERAQEPEKAIALLEEKIGQFSACEDAHLLLGMLYYKTYSISKAFSEFQKAISLMDKNEVEDFLFNSSKLVLETAFRDKYKLNDDNSLRELITYYWNSSDPLRLTDYNERLLEHIFRVAYANLHYGNKEKNIAGWKTDPGEAVLRYGEPLSVLAVRPYIDSNWKLILSNENIAYANINLSYVDASLLGNYRFTPETEQYISILRKTKPETYTPRFDGPKFNVVYDVLQFKNPQTYGEQKTDLYVSYALEVEDSLLHSDKYEIAHEYGLFIDNIHRKQMFKLKDSLNLLPAQRKLSLQDSLQSGKALVVNSIKASTKADTCLFDLEIMRNEDRGVAIERSKFNVKDFSKDNLQISDIVLSPYLDSKQSARTSITRGNISFLTNPTARFKKASDIFLYYEIYNLSLNKESVSDFEQSITMREYEGSSWIKRTFNSFLGTLGLKNNPKVMTLSSSNQMMDKDVQMYLKLDLSSFPKGMYILSVTLKDKSSKLETEAETPVILE